MKAKLKKVEVKTVCVFEHDGDFTVESRDYVYFNCTEKTAETSSLYAVASDGGTVIKRDVKTSKVVVVIDDAIISQHGKEIANTEEVANA